MHEFWTYEVLCLRFALRQFQIRIADHLPAAMFAFLASFFGAMFLVFYADADGNKEYGALVAYSLFGPIAAALTFFVFLWLRAPSRLFFDQRDTSQSLADSLEQFKSTLLVPKLSAEPLRQIAIGGLTESPYSGSRQIQIVQNDVMLRIHVKNEGKLRVEDVSAQLVKAVWVKPDETEVTLDLEEPVSLLWDRNIKKDVRRVCIEPSTSKAVYLLVARPAGFLLYRDGSQLPFEHQQYFLEMHKLILTLQIGSKSEEPVRCTVLVMRNEEVGTWRSPDHWSAEFV